MAREQYSPYHEPWVESATCRSIGFDAFFPDKYGQGKEVKSICMSTCPVRLDCLDYVMRMERGQDYKTRFGVWAGMTPLQRKRHEPEWLAGQEGDAA